MGSEEGRSGREAEIVFLIATGIAQHQEQGFDRGMRSQISQRFYGAEYSS